MSSGNVDFIESIKEKARKEVAKMSREEILNHLVSVFQSVFNREIKLEESTTASDVEGWDSLRHITLMTAIGNEFGRQFQMKDIVHLEDVGDIVTLIEDEI